MKSNINKVRIFYFKAENPKDSDHIFESKYYAVLHEVIKENKKSNVTHRVSCVIDLSNPSQALNTSGLSDLNLTLIAFNYLWICEEIVHDAINDTRILSYEEVKSLYPWVFSVIDSDSCPGHIVALKDLQVSGDTSEVPRCVCSNCSNLVDDVNPYFYTCKLRGGLIPKKLVNNLTCDDYKDEDSDVKGEVW